MGGPFENLGVAAGWAAVNESQLTSAFEAALRLGSNAIDTADVYGLGRAERLIGDAIERLSIRNEVIISTKVGYWRQRGLHAYDEENITHQFSQSLASLRVDRIDIYWFHQPDFGERDRFLAGALETVRSLQKAGLVRFVGLRGPHAYSPKKGPSAASGAQQNEKLKRFYELAARIDPDVVSVRYNALCGGPRSIAQDVVEWAERSGRGLFLYKPLAQGLLLGKYRPDAPQTFGWGDHRARKPEFAAGYLRLLQPALDWVAKEFGCQDAGSMARLSLRYCAGRCPTACILTGFTSVAQVFGTRGQESPLGAAECDLVEEAFACVPEPA